ncbi:MAG: hypothetical protein AAFY20_03530 [Cyanobacteria bacterium J06639_14]
MEDINQKDLEHLRLLSLFHYVLGGVVAALSLFSLLHISVGLAFLLSPETYSQSDGTEFAAEFGLMFLAGGLAVLIIGLTLALCLIISGRSLAKRKRYWFSFVVACIECINVPMGTVLGVFTLIVLCRESVKSLYALRRS